MLKMFDPTMLPTAISVCLRNAAITLVASSGSDVPTATMVSPITASEMPNSRAMVVALSTRKPAPITRATSPAPVMTQGFQFGPKVSVPPSGGWPLPAVKATVRKAARPTRRISPSSRVTCPSSSMTQIVAVAASMKARSRQSLRPGMISGAIRAEMPRIRSTLPMFEPITLPIAMPG